MEQHDIRVVLDAIEPDFTAVGRGRLFIAARRGHGDADANVVVLAVLRVAVTVGRAAIDTEIAP